MKIPKQAQEKTQTDEYKVFAYGSHQNLETYNTVKHIVQPHKRIHFHIRHQVEAELERLERLDIIEREHRPTHWVPPIVVATKP